MEILDSASFKKETDSSESPIIADFFATWCGPCKMMSPVLDKIKEKYGESIKILKIDIDKNSELSAEYNIMSVPTIMFFSNGEIVRRETGFIPEEKLLQIIESDFCALKQK